MLASRMAPARLPEEWLVKYETVIGTIGKTHGVKSDNAPTVIRSQMNDQSEPGPAVLNARTFVPGAMGAPFVSACEPGGGGGCDASLLNAGAWVGDLLLLAFVGVVAAVGVGFAF